LNKLSGGPQTLKNVAKLSFCVARQLWKIVKICCAALK
jgi:hypothetical protein